MTDKEIDEKLNRIHEIYGNDLAAFFRDAQYCINSYRRQVEAPHSKSFEDYFKEMEPYFDIKHVPGVGIVTGEYYYTVLNPKNASNSTTTE